MKFKYVLLALFILFMGIGILLFPIESTRACLYGFTLWAKCVLPSIFPFMIVTFLVINTPIGNTINKIFSKFTRWLRLPSCTLTCLFMALISGYPTGARVVSQYASKQLITKKQANILSMLCSIGGPLFVISSVGGEMFLSTGIGIKIYLTHVTVNLLAILLFFKDKKNDYPLTIPKVTHNNNILHECFQTSIIAVLVSGAFIAFFYTVYQIAQLLNLFYPFTILLKPLFGEQITSAFLTGFIEMTAGCSIASARCDKLSIATCGFLITFGGVSILCQQLAYLIPAGVKPLRFIAVKLIQATLCFLLLLI